MAESIVKLKNTKYVILESHLGKYNDFNTYNNILILNVMVADKTLVKILGFKKRLFINLGDNYKSS